MQILDRSTGEFRKAPRPSRHQHAGFLLRQRLRTAVPRQHDRHALLQMHANIRKAAVGPPIPGGISVMDLWAIHDLLLIGNKAPLLEADDAGRPTITAAVNSLAGMLDKIHPVATCRTAVAKATSLQGKADASWSCLGLSAKNFTGPFTSEKSHFIETANTEPNFGNMLGACAGSNWPRACSYWSSIHSMGVLADLEGKATEYFQAILHIISGGALYCYGCTSHWRFLNKYLLPKDLQPHDKLIAY